MICPFYGEIWSNWTYCSCSLCITALPLTAFQAGSSGEGAYQEFLLFLKCGHAFKKRWLGCCWTDCMQNAFLRCVGWSGLWKEETLLFTLSAYYLICQQPAVSGQREIKAAVEQNGIFVHDWLWKQSFDVLNWWEVKGKRGLLEHGSDFSQALGK